MKVVVSGGDITGLIVAYIMQIEGFDVVVVSKEEPGKSAKLPCFKFIENSKEVLRLLDFLDVLYGEYSLTSGIVLHGKILSCRRNLTTSVQLAYWKKTRLVNPPSDDVKGVTDPEVGPTRRAVSFDWNDFIKVLSRQVIINGIKPMDYDLHIATNPLWEYPEAGVTDAMAVELNLIPIKTFREQFIKFDIVYTPFTPCNVIHRFYHYAEGHVCEFSGNDVSEDDLASDLNFLFPDGWHLDGEVKKTYGYLLPLTHDPKWPERTIPVGRLAKWDDRITMTDVVRDTISIIKKYGKAR